MGQKEITVETIKKALNDYKFRDLFPDLKEEIEKWISNPGCKCNLPLYRTILAHTNQLKTYFGNDIKIEESIIEEEPEQVNQWKVVNCHIDELEGILQSLPHGPKQIAIARYEDQLTMVINDPIFN